MDLTGQVPRTDEVRAFLNDSTESRIKRSRLVERLLASPEYADHWALKWGDLLFSNRRFLGEKGLWAYRSWIPPVDRRQQASALSRNDPLW